MRHLIVILATFALSGIAFGDNVSASSSASSGISFGNDAPEEGNTGAMITACGTIAAAMITAAAMVMRRGRRDE